MGRTLDNGWVSLKKLKPPKKIDILIPTFKSDGRKITKSYLVCQYQSSEWNENNPEYWRLIPELNV